MLRQFKNLVSTQRFSYNGFSRFCAMANLKDDSKIPKAGKNPMVAKVISDVFSDDPAPPKSEGPNIDDIINNAKTVNGLLNIATQKDLNRKHALKIVSILAEWTTIERTNLDDFENDARFNKLCRMLGKTIPKRERVEFVQKPAINNLTNLTSDIDAILDVTGVDKALKLLSSITLDQMVKVMKNLALKKRRSAPLLQSLAVNISSKEERLNLKQCSDVLYSLATLNFTDVSLLSKICDDIQVTLKDSEVRKSSIIGSMLKSLALIKTRDIGVLDCLTEWIIKNQSMCRTQDVASLIMALAALNYMPIDHEAAIKEKIIPSLSPMDFKTTAEYLTFVWSLMALNINNEAAYDSVLQEEFIERLRGDFNNYMSTSAKLKLLSINAGVKLFMPNYKGAMLDRKKHKEIYETQITYNNDKQLLVKAMVDALRSLVPADQLQLNVDSGMGFTIDAQFHVDKKGNMTMPKSQEDPDIKKIAVLCYDYHDYCQGPFLHHTGLNALNFRLLQKKGVSIISVPYYDFSQNDLLVKRVQFLQKLIKNVSKAETT